MQPTVSLLPDRSAFLDRVVDIKAGKTPKRPGLYLRISRDPLELGEGVGRQEADGEALRVKLHWGVFEKTYRENDTGAWKKRKVTLADGRVVYRVIRPEFRQMLDDLADGTIDGIIFYDLDRLARQPSDLEDLLDISATTNTQVKQVTGELDLLSSSGRMVARMLVSAAEKSSADQSRRVARQAMQRATDGKRTNGQRAFGWKKGHAVLDPVEAELVREIIANVMAGMSVTSQTAMLTAREVPTAAGGKWHVSTVNQILRAPRIAGIRPYYGQHHETMPKVNEWNLRAVRRDGKFVMGDWEPIITVDEWVALQHQLDAGLHRGAGRISTHDYFLRGLLKCGKCGKGLVGGRHMRKQRRLYVCPAPALGGCSGIVRDARFLDELVPGLVVKYLQASGVKSTPAPAKPKGPSIASQQAKLERTLREMADDRISEDDGYRLIMMYREKITALTEADAVKPASHIDPARRATMLEELLSEDVDSARKRVIIGQVIEHVTVNPCTVRGARNDYASIVPVWR